MTDPDECPERIDIWKITMPNKLTDSINNVRAWVDHKSAIVAFDDVKAILDHIAALNGELAAIKGWLSVFQLDALLSPLKETNPFNSKTGVANAIRAHVLQGEK